MRKLTNSLAMRARHKMRKDGDKALGGRVHLQVCWRNPNPDALPTLEGSGGSSTPSLSNTYGYLAHLSKIGTVHGKHGQGNE